MRRFFLIIALIAPIFGSCSQVLDNPEETESQKLSGVYATLPQAVEEDIQTKSSASLNSSSKIEFSWKAGDVLGIVPTDGSTPQTSYSIASGEGTTSAEFDGGSWAVKEGHGYAAYLPYQEIVATSVDSVVISMTGQTQAENHSPAHLGDYDILYANSSAAANNTISFAFDRKISILRLVLSVPAGTYSSIMLSSEDAIFAESVSLSLSTGAVAPSTLSNSLELALDDVEVVDGDNLEAFFAVLPSDLAGKSITVLVMPSNDGDPISLIFAPSKAWQPGTTYKISSAKEILESCQMSTGTDFNAAVLAAAGNVAQNVYKISFKTGQVVTNTSAGYDITFNSETNEVVVSSNAEEFKLPADASYMFDGFTEMTEIDGMDKINTTDVTNMAGMFRNCLNLASLDVSGFETSNVTDMQMMFDSCRSLSVLDLSSFDTELVTTMYAMFNNCQVLEDLKISSFRTPSVVTFAQMFSGCSAIEQLDLSLWDVSHAYGFARMFKDCKKLSWLNIEGWNLDNAKNYGTSYHQDIFTGIAASNIGIDIASQKPTPLALYCYEPALGTIVGWLRECGCDLIDWLSPRPMEIPVLPDGSDFKTIIATKAGGYDKVGSIEFLTVNNVYELRGENILGTYPGIYVYVDDYGGTTNNVYVSTLAPKMEANTDCSGMFSGFGEVRTITGWGVVNTSNVVYANSMFAGCGELTYSDIQYMSTESMAAMYYMFAHCSLFDFGDKLKYFSTSNATDMEGMFQGCEALTDLDLLSFNTSNVTCMDYMFENCDNLQRIVFGDYFTIEDGCSVNDIINGLGRILEEGAKTMFVCSNNLWNRLTANVTETGYDSSKHSREADYALLPYDFIDHSYSYNSTHPIKRIVLITGSSYNDGTAMAHTDGAPVYREYQSAGYNTEAGRVEYEYRVYTSAKEFRLPADASDFFNLSEMSALEEIVGLEYLNTSAVTNMSGMFSNVKIPYLDLHSFDVSHVADMSGMFYSTDIKLINLDGFNTSSLTNMQNMFYASTKLEKIDMPTFDLTHVTNCSGAFGRCWSLYSVKLGTKFIIGNGCSTGNMFEELGIDVDASIHSGYNTTFYCTQNIYEGNIRDLLPQNNGCSYRYVGSADVGFDGGDNDGGRMTD